MYGFGDKDNDIDMLEGAGVGVVLGKWVYSCESCR